MVRHRRRTLPRLYLSETFLQCLSIALGDVELIPQRSHVLRLSLRHDSRIVRCGLLGYEVPADGVRNAREQDEDHGQHDGLMFRRKVFYLLEYDATSYTYTRSTLYATSASESAEIDAPR